MKLADPAHVAEQYCDSARFDARARIYELYDTSPESWLRWLFLRLGLRPGERVLELGCGTGNLWRENAQRVPEGTSLVLVEADAQRLPFDDASFDLVIASHMLYHVPDRAR